MKKPKKRVILRSAAKNNRVRFINVKANEEEYAEIMRKAEAFTNGDKSKWIRHAAINHWPDSSELMERR